MMPAFSYAEFTKRNIGFVTEAEQARLRQARVFVCGTGGMGGAALLAL
jgi:molybdopterin-synthase adenylyltransferase